MGLLLREILLDMLLGARGRRGRRFWPARRGGASTVLRTAALALLSLALLSLVAGGCRQREPVGDGRAMAYPEAQRIVSFAPSLTEIAYELELGDKLVGVSTFDTEPRAAALPRVGGMADPNLEMLVALEPDLVLTTPSVVRVEAFVAESLPEAWVVSQQIDTLGELHEAFVEVATKAGVRERGVERAEQLRNDLDALTLEVADEDARPRVLLVVGRDPGALSGLVAAGPGSFLDELLVRAGGRNALPERVGQWPVLGKEALLAHPPDLVLELWSADTPPPDDAITVWRDELPELEAVAQGRVERLGGAYLLLPGPRVVDTLRDLRDALAP